MQQAALAKLAAIPPCCPRRPPSDPDFGELSRAALQGRFVNFVDYFLQIRHSIASQLLSDVGTMGTSADIQQIFALGLQRHRSGDLREAESLYRQVLARQADHPDAIHLLGVIASQSGRHAEALELIGRAIAINPASAGDYYSNYGLALAGLRRFDEAIAAYEKSLALRPDLAAAHSNLAEALLAKGRMNEAIGQFRVAIQLQPNFAEAHNQLGRVLAHKGELNAAIAAFHGAVLARPNWAEAHFNLGNVLFQKCDYVQAAAAYRRSIQIRPDGAEALVNLGKALNLMEQIDEAIECFKKALKMRPTDTNALNALGNAYKDIARLGEAMECYQRAVELDPDFLVADSNRVYSMYFDPAYSAQAIVKEARVWDRRHSPAPAAANHAFGHDRSPRRSSASLAEPRLRIGYVSAYFRNHCQALFTPGLFAHHDHKQFEIFCYADLSRPDLVTERLRPCADHWRLTTALSDQAAADMIGADRIDILVDLTMHMGDGRLGVFARRPAPVQVCWLAYTGTTGLSAIEYRLTDPYLDPPGQHEDHYSETCVRLPHTFWCYEPLGMELEPNQLRDIGPLPALQNGHITFGCLNNFSKINDVVLDLWSKVMTALPQSRLRLLAPPGSARLGVLQRLGSHGIDADRIEFVGRQGRARYLNELHRIDLCLDTFPCNGHTTSLDSLWMGVPVVSRVGPTAMGRAGWSQLSNLGLTELAAWSDEEFVKTAVDLASDLPRLSELRRTLRQRLAASPIMDAPRFARDVEAAFRHMWRQWTA
jgi:protein O-GlcNAc transferase